MKTGRATVVRFIEGRKQVPLREVRETKPGLRQGQSSNQPRTQPKVPLAGVDPQVFEEYHYAGYGCASRPYS